MFPVMFCGISGFLDFYKPRWLRAILSWQKAREGCFGLPGELFLADRQWRMQRGWGWGREGGWRCYMPMQRIKQHIHMYTHAHMHSIHAHAE